MTLLVDTNVVLSAAIRDRLPERVVDAIAAHDDWYWMVTPEIESEYRDVLSRPKFKLEDSERREWIEFLDATVLHVEPTVLPPDFPRDPKDLPFLVAAMSTKADYLITGDKDLPDAQGLVSTRIVTVAEFARLFGIT